MSWDAVAALATAVQTAVVAGAAAAALVQIRHLRRQNNLAAMIELHKRWDTPEFRRGEAYVRDELPRRLADPVYRERIARGEASVDDHPEMAILSFYVRLGVWYTTRTIDPLVMFVQYHGAARSAWRMLLPVIALRRTTMPGYALGFEAFVIDGSSTDLAARMTAMRKRTPKKYKPLWDAYQADMDRALADFEA